MHDIFTVVFENEKSLNSEKGYNNDILLDLNNHPPWLPARSEKVIEGQNNTYIVLGRDRPGGLDSGYGGSGDEKAGAIDIVVGRLSHIKSVTLAGKKVANSIGGDAARITLSQKTDVDTNFKIVDGRTGKAMATSAVAIKADDVRIVARSSMKLVTGTDVFLSNGNKAQIKSGIQLIADNDDKNMQPIPKGINLQKALEAIYKDISELNGIVKGFFEAQSKFNDVLASHVHPFDPLSFPYFTQFGTDSAFPAISTTLPVAGKSAAIKMYNKVDQGLFLHQVNINSNIKKYLVADSSEYINSSFHYLN